MKRTIVKVLLILTFVIAMVILLLKAVNGEQSSKNKLCEEYTKNFPQEFLESKELNLDEFYPLDFDVWKTSGTLNKRITDKTYQWTIQEDDMIIFSVQAEGASIDEQLLFHKDFVFPDVLQDDLLKITLIQSDWYVEDYVEPGLIENNKGKKPLVIEPQFTSAEMNTLRKLVLTTDVNSAPIYFVEDGKVTDGWYANSFYWDKRNYTLHNGSPLLADENGVLTWDVCWYFKIAESIYYCSQTIAKDTDGNYYFYYEDNAEYTIKLPTEISQKIDDAFLQADVVF